MWPKTANNNHIITYILVTILLSISIALLINNNPEKLGALAGLWLIIPTMVAVTLNILHHGGLAKVYSLVFTGPTRSSFIFAILFPLGSLSVIAAIALLTKMASINTGNLPTVVDLILSLFGLIFAMVVFFGEEYGWRGFLLPALEHKSNKLKATIFVGILWAIYLSPSAYLAAKHFDSTNPLTVSLIQGIRTLALSFPIAYCYFLTEGSIIPVMLYRAIWDVAGSLLLGSGAETTPSLLVGHYTILKDGVYLDIFLNLVFILWFVKKYKSPSTTNPN